jgi:hypothetical protein
MFLTLQKYGHKIEEKYPGIYYVTEHLPFPAQIIVTQEIEQELQEIENRIAIYRRELGL